MMMMGRKVLTIRSCIIICTLFGLQVVAVEGGRFWTSTSNGGVGFVFASKNSGHASTNGCRHHDWYIARQQGPRLLPYNDKHGVARTRTTAMMIPHGFEAAAAADLLAASSSFVSSSSSTMTTMAGVSDLLLSSLGSMDQEVAESLAGPFFGASLFPYIAFLFFLSRQENECPKGVTVGFATCLLFVFLTIPAAVASKVLYGVSLADCDWLHGSAESLLTITNLVTVVAFRQALQVKEQQQQQGAAGGSIPMPRTATSYAPMTWLVVGLTLLAGVTALVPALSESTAVHTPYLYGFMDLPPESSAAFLQGRLGAFPEPDNALTIACWIIHVSSLVEFLVAMGFCWRWGDVVGNPAWKGLTWGLLPLHSSGITACTYHLFYNRIPLLVPLQAFLTCVGNTTAALGAYRIARSNGWNTDLPVLSDLPPFVDVVANNGDTSQEKKQESQSLVGFEDLGDALAQDTDYSFLVKLFVGCAIGSYMVKYGETFFLFPQDANVLTGLAVVAVPSALNAFKWYKRSQDPRFEGWF